MMNIITLTPEQIHDTKVAASAKLLKIAQTIHEATVNNSSATGYLDGIYDEMDEMELECLIELLEVLKENAEVTLEEKSFTKE